jgi:hypothetical protein
VLAEPTVITIRVISKDAKFIGTSMGGMRITLRDAHTGAVLATGSPRAARGARRASCRPMGAVHSFRTTLRPSLSPPWT